MASLDSDQFLKDFEQRKQDHIRISMDKGSQSLSSQFSSLRLLHNPLPELDFKEVSLKTQVFGHELASPLFISSMTLGHDHSGVLNQVLGQCAEKMGWMMGVGSQRRQLEDPAAGEECVRLRENFPKLVMFGNIGMSQLISSTPGQIESLVKSLKAQFLVVHLNPLQEVIQPEGTPNFRGGIEALKKLCMNLSVPVVLKETGSGFSINSLKKVKSLALAAVDLSGRGGTHWGRVEGLRQETNSDGYQLAKTFCDWGETTVESAFAARQAGLPFPFWASGGVRSGLDAAKLLVLGAEMVGLAQPLLLAAEKGADSLVQKMTLLEKELKVAMFCMGCGSLQDLIRKDDLWVKNPTF